MTPKKEYVLKLSDFERRLLIGLMTQVHNALLSAGKPTEDVGRLLQRIIKAPCRNVEVSR